MSCNQLSNKKPAESVIVTFDLSDGLAAGELITGVVSMSVAVSAGVDASPASILNGIAGIDATQSMVFQPVTAGLDTVNYSITVLASTSLGQRLACTAILPVRA